MAAERVDTGAMKPPRPKIALPVALLIATVFTTITAGSLYRGADVWANPEFISGLDAFLGALHRSAEVWRHPASILMGIPFSASLLFVLGTHELGHYFAARRPRVHTTLPVFIPGPPFPPLIGTFGAVIRIKSPITTRRALVDIGVAGPLAGFVAGLFVLAFGLMLSRPVPYVAGSGELWFGTSLIYKLLSSIIIGTVPDNYAVLLHPVAFAGWIGMFVTAMNLLPIGQLDGGHLVYALIGPRHRRFSMLVAASLIVLGWFTWPGWFLWAFLTTMLGLRHPPVYDEAEPIDRRTWVIAAVSLAVFVLTFMPTPFYIV